MDCQAYPGDGPGDNFATTLYSGTTPTFGNDVATVNAIQSWYNEQPAYAIDSNDYTAIPDGTNGKFDSWGHFSQLVWSTTSDVGCWSVFCGPGTPYLEWASAFAGWQPGSAWNVVCSWDPGK